MSKERFYHLYSLVKPLIKNKTRGFVKLIPTRERLDLHYAA